MTGIRTCLLILSCLSVLIAGCAKRNPQRAAGAGDELGRTASERVSDTQRSIKGLRQTVGRMPGASEQDDRRLIAQALAQTGAALAAIEGDRPGGSFRQQLRIIENARGQLQRMGADVPSEPVIDSAIRAAHNALVSLRDGRFGGNVRVAKAVNEVGQQIPQLDSVRGPLHSLAVSQTFDSIAGALETMSNVLEGRLEQPAAARTTTRPAA